MIIGILNQEIKFCTIYNLLYFKESKMLILVILLLTISSFMSGVIASKYVSKYLLPDLKDDK